MTWLVLGFRPGSARRDFAELVLDATIVRRVDPASAALMAHVDPRWAVTEAFVIQSPEAAGWEARLARELSTALAEDVSGQAREIEAGTLPDPLPLPSQKRPSDDPSAEPAAFATWLSRISDERGFITDDGLRSALAEHHRADSPLRVARARAKPEDVEALSTLVRDRFDAALPADYRRFLTEVGALRIEAVDGETKSPLRDVLLPAKSVARISERGSWLADGEDGLFLPFYRFGDDEYFAFDFSAATPCIVGAYFTGEIEVVARSFTEWLRLWREANLLPSLGVDDEPACPGVFGDAASFERWWKRNATWVREMYGGV